MSRIFDADNAFFRFMSRVADALILNFFFLITSIPIVTVGASYTAMYYYCTKAVGNEEGYLWKSYWKSFKTNFVQGFLLEVFFAIIGIILYVDLKFLYGKAFGGGAFGWRLLFFIVVGMAVLAIVTFMYSFPLLSRFDNTTLHIIRNAAFMSVRHLPQTVPLLFILAIMVLIGWAMFPVSIFFIMGAWVYISSIFFHKILDRYMPKDERYEDDYYLGADANENGETLGTTENDTVSVEDGTEVNRIVMTEADAADNRTQSDESNAGETEAAEQVDDNNAADGGTTVDN